MLIWLHLLNKTSLLYFDITINGTKVQSMAELCDYCLWGKQNVLAKNYFHDEAVPRICFDVRLLDYRSTYNPNQ